jgi:hypothetical protein
MAVRVPSTRTRQPPSTRASDPQWRTWSTVGRVCRASTVASWWDSRRSVNSRATARRGMHREGRPETFDGRVCSATASEKEPQWPPARKHRGHAFPSFSSARSPAPPTFGPSRSRRRVKCRHSPSGFPAGPGSERCGPTRCHRVVRCPCLRCPRLRRGPRVPRAR